MKNGVPRGCDQQPQGGLSRSNNRSLPVCSMIPLDLTVSIFRAICGTRGGPAAASGARTATGQDGKSGRLAGW